jgi:DNA-binding MarR family transcriptional regulator
MKSPVSLIAHDGATMAVKGSGKSISETVEAGPSWTFLTNHAHVLICLAREPDCVLRRVASLVGITERAVQRIVSDLVEAGYIKRRKDGRRNVYQLLLSKSLRHDLEANCKIGELIDLIK